MILLEFFKHQIKIQTYKNVKLMSTQRSVKLNLYILVQTSKKRKNSKDCLCRHIAFLLNQKFVNSFARALKFLCFPQNSLNLYFTANQPESPDYSSNILKFTKLSLSNNNLWQPNPFCECDIYFGFKKNFENLKSSKLCKNACF